MLRNFVAKQKAMTDNTSKKIPKKAYAVMQDALFEKAGDGSYKAREMAKEGMTSLKKHATSLTVVCTDSSIEDVTALLKKNDIPYDKVIRIEDHFDYIVMGNDNSIRAWSWTGALEDIGWKLKNEPENKPDAQKKADNSLEHFFKKVKDTCNCIG